jgi:hypothetical protein
VRRSFETADGTIVFVVAAAATVGADEKPRPVLCYSGQGRLFTAAGLDLGF